MNTHSLSVCMGVFVCADDTTGICGGQLIFFEKCIFTEKSEIFLVHRSFIKSPKRVTTWSYFLAVTATSLPLGNVHILWRKQRGIMSVWLSRLASAISRTGDGILVLTRFRHWKPENQKMCHLCPLDLQASSSQCHHAVGRAAQSQKFGS